MTGRHRRLLRAGLLAGAALVVVSALWAVLQAVAATTREDRVRLTGNLATVSLEVDQGDLDVRAAGRGVVEAIARERSFLIGIGGEAGIEGDEARLRWTCRLWTSCRVDVRARVPEDVALEARSGLGDVTVEGPVGDVELRTRSGHIDARAIGGRRARVEARQGDVRLTFTDAPSDVTVEVSSGDVELVVPAGAYRLDATTRSGEIGLISVRDDPQAARAITVDVTAGDIVVRGRTGGLQVPQA